MRCAQVGPEPGQAGYGKTDTEEKARVWVRGRKEDIDSL